MIIAALLILGASLLFVAIAMTAIVFCIVLPMREELAQERAERLRQEDAIERNAGATIGLYAAHQNRLNRLSDKLEFVEAYAVPTLPKIEEAPITVRSARRGVAA